jgi:hypothetical protein
MAPWDPEAVLRQGRLDRERHPGRPGSRQESKDEPESRGQKAVGRAHRLKEEEVDERMRALPPPHQA